MKTFRTEEEAREAGWYVLANGIDALCLQDQAFGLGPVLKVARILSPETLKLVEALESCEADDEGGWYCPSCKGRPKSSKRLGSENGPLVHAPDCKLDLALRQVGVRG